MSIYSVKLPSILASWGVLAGLFFLVISSASAADFFPIYEGLFGGESVYGVDATTEDSPFVNADNYSILASGEDTGTSANVSFNVYGLYAGAGVDIENSGQISLTAVGGTPGGISPLYAEIDAIAIKTDGSVDNSGALTVNVTGGTASAPTSKVWAYVDAYGIVSGGTVNNDGAITITATGATATADDGYVSVIAYGIDAQDTVTNTGDIAVSSSGGNTTSYDEVYASALAIGISSMADVTNYGDLVVDATGGTGASISDLFNVGWATAYGIESAAAVNNQGAITVTATGGQLTKEGSGNSRTYAYAYGIDSAGPVSNSGAITVTAQGGDAIGGTSSPDGDSYADAWGIRSEGDIDNSGSITVSATGGTSTADSSEPYALAIGLQTNGTIQNSGDISVTATYGEGTGTDPFSTGLADAHAGALGIVSGGGDIFNNGNIRVEAVAPENLDTAAVGILFVGDGQLTNTGIIRAFGDRAYEVAIMAGTVTLQGSYTISLDGDPNVGSLFIGSGATLALNGASLNVASLEGETLFDTEYRIFDTEEGTVSGAFGAVSALNPGVTATYHDQSTADSADDTLSLSYQPMASPQLEAISMLRHAVTLSADLVGQRLVTGFLQNRLATRTPRLYAAARTVVSDAGNYYAPEATAGFFFTPYYANVDKDDSPAGYNADLVGFVAGLEQHARGNLYGFHLGFGHAALDFTGSGYRGNKEDQEVLSGGLHLMGNQNNWTWRSQLTGFYGWHDYDGRTGVSLEQKESADYESYGARVTLLAGHLVQRGSQILLPEVGVEYLWLHRESFTTKADNPVWNMRNDSVDEHQLSALASLRWLTRLQAGDLEITPSLASGLRYLITDDEIDAKQSVAGSAPVTVKADQDDLVGTVSASVRLRKENTAAELAYSGDFSEDTTMHSAWLRFSYLF